ncbi:hypothetical protein LTR37_017209 [Vermiconidia calcicola]|uniref:Uncharacterized protein n=1 Tax=Vermiconidia calcicola TaxID=1690605 RepID=A0ACC3MKP3_9PEZI|nr:hypothetical protein LTR37_017209 [Vermiconidia calcicola]
MRLINTTSHKLEEFFDRPVPPYAILSHRWQVCEATLQNYRSSQGEDGPGIGKVINFCKFAKTQSPSHRYVWIDTCCINKQNSMELMEAINSMYTWYENAQTCFVYLRDLPPKEEVHKKERRDAFCNSEWFHRGWTLQELLAPSRVIFCDRDWKVYDSRVQLAKQIEGITGIAKPFLDGTYQPRRASVAMRMSWASKRYTTKPEDKAYCLLGLFDVNMPLLYGEQKRAFMRFQEEILKHSDDESIFAWTANYTQWGMLAPSPEAFQGSEDIVNFKLAPEQRMPFQMTNKGLRFPSASDTYAKDNVDPSTGEPMGYDDHVVELGCFFGRIKGMTGQHSDALEMWEDGPITIRLKRIGPTWQRVECDNLGQGQNSARRVRRNGSYFGRGVQRIYFIEQPLL